MFANHKIHLKIVFQVIFVLWIIFGIILSPIVFTFISILNAYNRIFEFENSLPYLQKRKKLDESGAHSNS